MTILSIVFTFIQMVILSFNPNKYYNNNHLQNIVRHILVDRSIYGCSHISHKNEILFSSTFHFSPIRN